jgi:hypothetical protein
MILIIVFSVVMIFNIYLNQYERKNKTEYTDDVISADVMNEIEDVFVDENDEVEIGEMI